MSAALVEIEPGGLRELHWHPTSDEWQYYLSGTARMTLFASEGRANTVDFAPSDVGYVLRSMGHYTRRRASEHRRIRCAQPAAGQNACRSGLMPRADSRGSATQTTKEKWSSSAGPPQKSPTSQNGSAQKRPPKNGQRTPTTASGSSTSTKKAKWPTEMPLKNCYLETPLISIVNNKSGQYNEGR